MGFARECETVTLGVRRKQHVVLLSDRTTRQESGIWEIVKSLKEPLISGTMVYLADDAS